MKLPAITIDLEKIEHNARTIVDLCESQRISVTAVTKGFCAIPEIASAVVRGGVHMLADSRIENLMKLKHLKIPKVLLRLPMLSQIEAVVKYADISLNSEMDTIRSLSEKALEMNTVHKIILMVDLGDLREGVWRDQAVSSVGEILQLQGVSLIGIGTNLTCFGAVLPSVENLSTLGELAREIEATYDIEMEVVSGGNSSSIYLVENGMIPSEINQLRLGESILFGTECAYGNRLENTYTDAFKLYAEVVELKEKPSIPIGEIGLDAFKKKPVFIDRGVRKRAILGIGKQDVILDTLTPKDKGILILGASSDHLVIDVTDSDKSYKIGDVLEFGMQYSGMLSAMTSDYVSKEIIKTAILENVVHFTNKY